VSVGVLSPPHAAAAKTIRAVTKCRERTLTCP
jgi:hypothetical protein